MDCSLPGSSVHGIFQVRILELVAISFSSGSSQPRDQTWVSCIAGRFFIDWSPSWRSLSKSCKCPDILLSLPNPSTGAQSPLVTSSMSRVHYTGPYTCNTIFSFPLLDVGAEELLELELRLPLVPPHSWSCFLTPGHTKLALFLVQGCRAVEHLLTGSWL